MSLKVASVTGEGLRGGGETRLTGGGAEASGAACRRPVGPAPVAGPYVALLPLSGACAPLSGRHAGPGGGEWHEVQARGELQLGVLIEGLRRDGCELAVSPPQVLLR